MNNSIKLADAVAYIEGSTLCNPSRNLSIIIIGIIIINRQNRIMSFMCNELIHVGNKDRIIYRNLLCSYLPYYS